MPFVLMIEQVTAPGTATLPGTCGELFQGLLDDQPCLVSCPIDSFASAQVSLMSNASDWQSDQPISKTLAALTLASYRLNLPTGGRVAIQSSLPRGRGYASSTADIGAALYALARAAQIPLPPSSVAHLAVQVEPSDSTFFPGLSLFAHQSGEQLADLGAAPALGILLLDPGGRVDTVAYNREVTRAALRPFQAQYKEAFNLLQSGLNNGDWEQVGMAATLSARTHQYILFNSLVNVALDLCQKLGGLGICRAHSGTIVGVLFDPQKMQGDSLRQRVRQRITPDISISLYQLIGGGQKWVNNSR